MPWRLTVTEDLRVQFVIEALHGDDVFAELCRAFSISRKTGYKWLSRYQAHGALGLTDRSRAPHAHPQAMDPAVAARLLAVRQRHPTWGARKLIAWLRAREPDLPLPAVSSANALLKRFNLLRRR